MGNIYEDEYFDAINNINWDDCHNEFNEMFNSFFALYDRKEFDKFLKILNVSQSDLISQLLCYYLNNQSLAADFFLNFNLSSDSRNKMLLMSSEQFPGSKLNLNQLEYFITLFRKILAFEFANNKGEFLESGIFQIYSRNLFFIDELNKSLVINSSTKNLSGRIFQLSSTTKVKLSSIRNELKGQGFISNDTLMENFEIIFGVRKRGRKKIKVNWKTSYRDIKDFINFMFHEKIIVKDLSYLDTISDCFTLHGEEFLREKMEDPRGVRKDWALILKLK